MILLSESFCPRMKIFQYLLLISWQTVVILEHKQKNMDITIKLLNNPHVILFQIILLWVLKTRSIININFKLFNAITVPIELILHKFWLVEPVSMISNIDKWLSPILILMLSDLHGGG